MTFEQVRQELSDLTQKAEKPIYDDLELYTALDDLLARIKDNIGWYIQHDIATAKNFKKWFGVKFLEAKSVYITGTHELELVEQDIMIVVLGRAHATIKAKYNCGHNIILGENSSASVIAQNSTSIGIDTYKSSYVSVWAKNDSGLRVRTFDESSVTAQVVDSTATVKIN
jgi:hypothetical protein